MVAAQASLTGDDRAVLRDSVRGLLEDRWPPAQAVDRSAQPDAVRGAWKLLAEQGLGDLGGAGSAGGWREVLLVMEELGRAGCPVPMLEAALCSHLASRIDPAPDWLREFAHAVQAGEALPAIALGPCDGDTGAGRCIAANGRLDGILGLVEGLAASTHLLVVPDGESGLALVTAGAKGVSLRPTPGLAVPALGEVRLDAAPGKLAGLAQPELADMARLMRLGLAARALGAARRAFDLLLEHAKTRKQFGQPIGRFQAIQHKLADCMIALESSGLLLDRAADRVDAGEEDWRVLAAAAFAFSARELRQVALEIQHTFAAIGFSEEHEAPRHFRRVHADVSRLGGVRHSREEVAAFLLRGGGARMPDLDLGPAANAFRAEVRTWLAEHWNAEARRRSRAAPFAERPIDREFSRRLGEKGWIAVSWPREYGGQGRSPAEQYAFVEEMMYAGAPTAAHICAAELIGPALIAFGTAAQKQEFLPAFQRGERMFGLGYSEAGAGSDLASLRTTAVRDGDDWIIDGEKLWTSRGEAIDYHWLAVRTDPQASPPHAGISIFMVPLDLPGITLRPGMALHGHTLCSVHYDHVRVPDTARVGSVNGGWKVITHALAAERVLMGGSVAAIRCLFDQLVGHVAGAGVGHGLSAADPVIRDRLGALAAEIEAARQLAVLAVRALENGRTPVHEAAMSKVYSGELMERLTETAIDLLGARATIGEDGGDAPIGGRIEQMLRHAIMMVVGGGTAQIQRNLIAQRGLGLPR